MGSMKFGRLFQPGRKLLNRVTTSPTVFLPYSTSELANTNPLRNLKGRSKIDRASHFVDFRKVRVFGGKGGDGCIAFLQLWCNPLGGPSGGDGGNGGHVMFQAEHNVKSLENVMSLYKAHDGGPGQSKDMTGENAEHIVVEVPIGTCIKDAEGQVVADLDDEKAKFVAARGGAGGKGNHFFLSNENRHPRVAEMGAKGENKVYTLELKIMAHAGMIGFPNVGKSTLLRAISRARPKVAAYPFTTLNPHVGIVHYDDYEQIAVADLPGLIPGAHKNRGLGFAFLKHVERCLCLLYVIDISYEKPWVQLDALKYELEQYQEGLSERPHAILANKIDVPGSEANLKALTDRGLNIPIFPISAKTGTNVLNALHFLRKLYDNHSKDKFRW